MLSDSFYQKLIDILLSKGGDYADIYCEDEDLFSVVIENSRIKNIKSGSDSGLHLRLVIGDKTYSACTNSFDEALLTKMAQNIAQSVSLQNTVSAKQLSACANNPGGKQDLGIYGETIENFISSSKQIYQASPKIVQATLNYYNSFKNVKVFNSLGESCFDNRIYSRYTVNVVAKDGEKAETAYEGPGMTGGADLFAKYPLAESVDRVIKRVILMLGAKDAPTGKLPVILMGEAGGTMIHEACGHALEADFIYKDTSIFKNKIGKVVANPCVTVVDDATVPGIYGTYNCDDEGVKAQKTILIENGILKRYMTDRLSAKLLNLPLTGNGRRESYLSKPVPRMSNTFIENQDKTPQEVIASVDNGILVKRMGGGQVNITNGEFIFEVSEGYKVEKGKIVYPIRGASLIGKGTDVLMNIEMAANDKTFIPGVCGKFDHVPVGDAQPTLKISEMTIGGR